MYENRNEILEKSVSLWALQSHSCRYFWIRLPTYLLTMTTVIDQHVVFTFQNVVLIKDKCSYAYCKFTDTVAFCGGLESNFLISQEVCLLKLNENSYKTSTMTTKRTGATSFFVDGSFLLTKQLLDFIVVLAKY